MTTKHVAGKKQYEIVEPIDEHVENIQKNESKIKKQRKLNKQNRRIPRENSKRDGGGGINRETGDRRKAIEIIVQRWEEL